MNGLITFRQFLILMGCAVLLYSCGLRSLTSHETEIQDGLRGHSGKHKRCTKCMQVAAGWKESQPAALPLIPNPVSTGTAEREIPAAAQNLPEAPHARIPETMQPAFASRKAPAAARMRLRIPPAKHQQPVATLKRQSTDEVNDPSAIAITGFVFAILAIATLGLWFLLVANRVTGIIVPLLVIACLFFFIGGFFWCKMGIERASGTPQTLARIGMVLILLPMLVFLIALITGS